MLIKTPSTTTIPTKKEALDDLRLKNKQDLERYKIPNQEHLTDPERAGSKVPFFEIVKVVKQLNPSIWFEEARLNPGHGGLYRTGTDGQPEFLTAFAMDFLPEFTVVHKDERGLPHKADRGWREVLIMLLKKGAITKQQILKHFSNPSYNVRSEGWFRKSQGVN